MVFKQSEIAKEKVFVIFTFSHSSFQSLRGRKMSQIEREKKTVLAIKHGKSIKAFAMVRKRKEEFFTFFLLLPTRRCKKCELLKIAFFAFFLL